MNKTSYIFLAIGILILGIVFVVMQKPFSKQPTEAVTQNPVPLSQALEFNFSYKNDGSAQPQSYRVMEGQKVVLKITSEAADEAHFHGYDLQKELLANQTGAIEFTADKTGRFELELENAKITLGYLEVYPASGSEQRQ